MRLNRKFMACALITSMAISPMGIFAADETSMSNATGKDITGTGTLEGWVDEDQFCVTLPTLADSGLAFQLDPQGLISAVSADAGDDTKGKIIFADGTKVELVNKSSYDVGFDVKLTLTSSDKDLKVTTSSAVATGKDRNIYIAAQPLDSSGEVISGKDQAVGADGTKRFAYALGDAYQYYKHTKSGDTYSFALDTSASDPTYDTVAFGFTGLVNENADWSNFDGDDADTLELKVSYTIKKLAEEYDDIEAGTVDGITMDATAKGLLSTKRAPGDEKASAPASAKFMNGKGLATTEVYYTVINDVYLGDGELGANGISSVKWGNTAAQATTAITAATQAPTAASNKCYVYDAANETLTLYGPVVATTATEDSESYLVITFDDADKTTATIKLTNTLRPTN